MISTVTKRASSGGNRCFQYSTGPNTERRPGGSTQISRGRQGRYASKSKNYRLFPMKPGSLTLWGIFGIKFPLIPINSPFFQKVPIFSQAPKWFGPQWSGVMGGPFFGAKGEAPASAGAGWSGDLLSTGLPQLCRGVKSSTLRRRRSCFTLMEQRAGLCRVIITRCREEGRSMNMKEGDVVTAALALPAASRGHDHQETDRQPAR